MRQKVNVKDAEVADLPLTALEELKQTEYLSDFTDRIDLLVESAKRIKKEEKKAILYDAQNRMNAYETYVGRKIYTPVI
jgi:hypothetical protein